MSPENLSRRNTIARSCGAEPKYGCQRMIENVRLQYSGAGLSYQGHIQLCKPPRAYLCIVRQLFHITKPSCCVVKYKAQLLKRPIQRHHVAASLDEPFIAGVDAAAYLQTAIQRAPKQLFHNPVRTKPATSRVDTFLVTKPCDSADVFLLHQAQIEQAALVFN